MEMKISIDSEGKLIQGKGKDCKVAVAAKRKRFKKFFAKKVNQLKSKLINLHKRSEGKYLKIKTTKYDYLV